MNKVVKLTETDLHNMIIEGVKKVLKENEMEEMGTPKQNAFLKKLMGDRHKPEYDNLSVADTSKMIDQELKNQSQKNLSNGIVYQVVDNDTVKEFGSFREAKKAFDEAIDEYYELRGCGGDVALVKVSDICYKFYGRESRMCLGVVYIKKVQK